MKVGLASVVERCRDRGYEPTFHHETGTYVEAPWEIQRILDISDVGLCLDTGHFFIGGGDPVVAIHEWADRINHVHVKDALQSVMDGIIADNVPTMNIWSREAFPAFGDGDANVAGVLAALKDIDYEGWLVVEQDIFPQTSDSLRTGDRRPEEESSLPRRSPGVARCSVSDLWARGAWAARTCARLASLHDVPSSPSPSPSTRCATTAVANFDVIGHATLAEMLASDGIDGVLIVTPSDSHVDVIALSRRPDCQSSARSRAVSRPRTPGEPSRSCATPASPCRSAIGAASSRVSSCCAKESKVVTSVTSSRCRVSNGMASRRRQPCPVAWLDYVLLT